MRGEVGLRTNNGKADRDVPAGRRIAPRSTFPAWYRVHLSIDTAYLSVLISLSAEHLERYRLQWFQQPRQSSEISLYLVTS